MQTTAKQYQEAAGSNVRVFPGKGEGSHGSDFIKGLLKEINITRIGVLLLQSLYCLIGLAAAVVSFLLEKEVFARITGQPEFSFWIVLVLETAKVLTVPIYGYHIRNTGDDIPIGTRFMVRSLQFFLVTISIVCSLAMVSFSLDRPNLEEVRKRDMQQLEAKYREDMKLAQDRYDGETANLRADLDKEFVERFKRLQSEYSPRIEQHKKDLRLEMENVQNGTFRGERYREFERLLKESQTEYDAKKAALNREKEIAAARLDGVLSQKETAFRQEMAAMSAGFEESAKKIRTGRYAEDERAANRMVSAVLNTINDGFLGPMFGGEMKPVVFTCMFSLIISFLLEAIIYVTLFSAVLTFAPSLNLLYEFSGREGGVKKK